MRPTRALRKGYLVRRGKGSWHQLHSRKSLGLRAEDRAAETAERCGELVARIAIEQAERRVPLSVPQLVDRLRDRIGQGRVIAPCARLRRRRRAAARDSRASATAAARRRRWFPAPAESRRRRPCPRAIGAANAASRAPLAVATRRRRCAGIHPPWRLSRHRTGRAARSR